jgi:nucleoside phosphorylase
MTGALTDRLSRVYQLVVAFVNTPGPTPMANAVSATLDRFGPRYLLLVGIAGGFALDELTRGDVALSSVIYNYEYGKITTEFQPRHDQTYQVDGALLRSAVALHARDPEWITMDGLKRPDGTDGKPKLLQGVIASGGKVIDNAENPLFASVRDSWPKILAVEMEGAGAVATINDAVSGGHQVGFLMIRGISDMPKVGGTGEQGTQSVEGNKAERDQWKKYAAAAAARFTVHWMLTSWPILPASRSRRPSPPRPPDAGGRPASSGSPADSAAAAEVLAGTTETSVWLGFDPKAPLPQTATGGQLLTENVTAGESANSPIADLKRRFARASAELLRWPTTVGDKWLERPELDALRAKLTTTPHSVTIVLGPPGSGKSAFLARLGQQWDSSGGVVLAVKADKVRASVDSTTKLAEWLDLPAPTDQAVFAVAAVEPVVVLLDQLDALADLADLRSERLHVLLNLVQRLCGQPNVHVVCSCREFEYQHDGRLSRLDAEEVRLQPPTWAQVAEVLVARGVSADGWPEDAKELLRVPYNLALFLNRLRGAGEHPVFTSYQQLFNDLWDRQVVQPGGGRAELLYDLAAALAESEELWIDRDWFADRRALLDPLIAADILSPTEDGFRIGFRHQSLFEFVRAKAFAREGASLADYVLARQDALFVRPTLWMTLNYLRRASPAIYAREFDRLWQTAHQRHIKHLLIDFLSQVEQPPPDDREQARLVEALRDGSWRKKVLTAVTGKQAWFGLLAGAHLSAEMRKPHEAAWDVVWVLVTAFGFDRERCLQLMEQNWLPDDAKLTHVWQTLTYLGEWDEHAVGLARAVVRRTDVEHSRMWRLAQTIAKDQPALAVALMIEWLDAARRRIMSVATGEEGVRADRLRKVLDSHTQWHDVGELASRVPADFVLGVWPILRVIVTGLESYASEHVVRYAEDRLCFSRLDGREYVAFDSPDRFFLALDAALREFARQRPDDFYDLVRTTGNPGSRLLQRLMCRGLREVVSTHSGVAFEFLMSDPRRFWLGGLHDDLGDSHELVAAVAPHLGDEEFAALATAIRGWEMYREREGEPRDPGNIYARGHRFRLLSALPADRLPDDVRRELADESSSLPDYVREARSHTGTGLQLIGSPVSRDEMTDLADEAIAGLFDELPDATEAHHPNDRMLGGSVQLSQEFGEFAKTHPERALTVLRRLRPGDQERPAAYGVRGLVAAKRPTAEIIGLVEQLDSRGFTGQEFRETVAFALSDLAQSTGLPDNACALLHRWRLAEWPDNDCAESDREERGEPNRPASILWQYGGSYMLPHGRFPVLSALTRGYLCRQPHAADLWLDMLVDHVEREESLTNWRGMCHYLGDVCCCSDRDRARTFLARLFDRYPGVLTCQVGVHLLARVAPLLSDEQRQRAYASVRGWDAERGAQAFGELVCLRHLQHPDDVWATGQVEGAFVTTAVPGCDQVLIGIAFAAANLWDDPVCRTLATDLLRRVLAIPGEAAVSAAMTVFHTRDELPLDAPTLALLRQVGAHPEVLVRADVDEAFFDHLLDAFVVEPELVCHISEEAVRLRGRELSSIQQRLFMAGSALIDVSLRLQRSGGDFRRRGMALFEALLDRGVSEAMSVARSNDHRLVPGGHPYRHLRRKRAE